jgi:6-phosphofructokinase 1
MRVVILTSGGDSPGMNAGVRAIVRVGINRGIKIFGVPGGYQGILDGEFERLTARWVANIMHRGGTHLTTGRSEEFRIKEGQERAAAIGGDGTMRGMMALGKVWDGRLIGLPGTIDNDIYGTDYSIGFDTAVNNAMRAIDKIRDTARSFARVFVVEVMGRDAGHIAVHVGIASGAEAIVIPETTTDVEAMARKIKDGRKRGRTSAIVVVAEGDEEGGAADIASKLSEQLLEKCRVSVLGYIQRGGSPTRMDRMLATRMGVHAIECLLEGKEQGMIGEIDGHLCVTPFEEVTTKKNPLDEWMLELVGELAT